MFRTPIPATHQTTVWFADGLLAEMKQHTTAGRAHSYLDRIVQIQENGLLPADLTARIEALPVTDGLIEIPVNVHVAAGQSIQEAFLAVCHTCSGTGTVYVQGCEPRDQVADSCPDCDGTGR